MIFFDFLNIFVYFGIWFFWDWVGGVLGKPAGRRADLIGLDSIGLGVRIALAQRTR